MLRFSAVVKTELERSDHRVALIARSGLDLRRFGVRYTHAGVSLRNGGRTAWSVRQLYYACDEDRPLVFDQGISGFLFGLDDPSGGFISLVLLPAAAEADLERSAMDDRLAVQLLGARYSPNAYPYRGSLPELQPVAGGAARRRVERARGRPSDAAPRGAGLVACTRLPPGPLRVRIPAAALAERGGAARAGATTIRPKTWTGCSCRSACRRRSKRSFVVDIRRPSASSCAAAASRS